MSSQVKYKTKMLGNIRLVGELIRHGMSRTQAHPASRASVGNRFGWHALQHLRLAPKIAIAVASELARTFLGFRSLRPRAAPVNAHEEMTLQCAASAWKRWLPSLWQPHFVLEAQLTS